MLTARFAPDVRSAASVHGRVAVGFCMAVVMAGSLAACFDLSSPVLTRLLEARRLTAELLVRFTKAADAANRAVMADTDEVSLAFAHEAEQETHAVQGDLGKLEGIVRSLHYSDEVALLAEFRAAFAKYRALDHEVLQLAVENTNLKAQRLSFGPAHEAANALRDSLDTLTRAVPEKDSWRARALAATALLSVREIEVLQGPHIAASEDSVMTTLEQQMATLEANARGALTELGSLSKPELAPAIDTASAALTRFMGIHTQLIALSRRNSNVRSLALSLGQKRTLTAACETSLRALGHRLAKRDFTATR
jgi:hypothetical protein